MEVQKLDNFIEKPQPINLNEIQGFIRTVSAIPTIIPTKINEQFVIYKSGATKRLYVADLTNSTWHYVSII